MLSLKRQPSQITASKITLGGGPVPEEEAEQSSTHDKASGLLDAIIEAWQTQAGEEGGSLQVTIMTEEPEEQDIGVLESGGPSLRASRAKPDR